MSDKLYDEIKKVEVKVDKLDNRLDTISESQVRMEADVKYHIKRTDELQEMVRKHDKLYAITMFIVAATPVVIGILVGVKRIVW
jgi:predicted DNA-binding protein YlxM (UPF0122 family)